MLFDADRLRANAQQATTEDLLDRVTVFREEMEPEARAIHDDVLAERGITSRDIEDHWLRRAKVLRDEEGRPRRCSRCLRPAVVEEEDWHRLWGRFPLYRKLFYLCDEHRSPVATPLPSPDPQPPPE